MPIRCLSRRLVAAAACLALSWSVAQPLGAQEGDGNELRNHSNRLLANCNYVEYVNRVNTVGQSFFFVKEFKNTVDALFSGSLFSGGLFGSIDLIRSRIKSNHQKALDRQLISTASGIIFQFEQACNTFKMAQDTERQMVELTKANWNVRGMLKDVVTSYDIKIALVRDRLQVVANLALLERNLRPSTAPTAADYDGVFEAAVDTAALSAFGARSQLHQGIAGLEPTVAELKFQLYEYASYGLDGKLSCPKGYDRLPSPLPPGRSNMRGVICGPATPARMAQITAMLATVQMEEQALTNSVKAQELALMSMRALREAQDQRTKRLATRNALGSFTGGLAPIKSTG